MGAVRAFANIAAVHVWRTPLVLNRFVNVVISICLPRMEYNAAMFVVTCGALCVNAVHYVWLFVLVGVPIGCRHLGYDIIIQPNARFG